MLRRLFVLLLLTCGLAAIAAWVISPEMAETWVYSRTRGVEAALAARDEVWLIRGAAPAVAIGAWLGLRRWARTERALRTLWREFLSATSLHNVDGSLARVRSELFRGSIAACLLLSAVHWESGVRRVVHEWPVYRWTTGTRVLPNVSESNRDVIRYVQATTPEDARVLAVSDQTVFFLSYYLWPRVVLHRPHPDSQFVVPQPGQSRQLAAYRLQDLSHEDLARLAPDYVLEYFEGRDYFDAQRVFEDPMWTRFVREQHKDGAYVPPCNVRLRPVDEVLRGP